MLKRENYFFSIFLDEFLEDHESDEPIEFEQVPFHHPQFIMFSSGTTGVPKCMVHSVGVSNKALVIFIYFSIISS